MDPLRAIAPIVALASFAVVVARALISGTSAASALFDALFAMAVGFVVGSFASMVVRHVVDQHNKQYAEEKAIPPLAFNTPNTTDAEGNASKAES